MIDSYGASALPLEAPADPVRQVLGEYLKACLNYYAQAAWAALAPNRGNVVRNINVNDPTDSTFNTADLPALFLWTDPKSIRFERVADDWETKVSDLHIVWAPTPAVQANRSAWDPFLQDIAKVIDYALWNGRDPAWIQTEDTDPEKTTRGTLLLRAAGLFKDPGLTRAEIVPIEITMADGSPRRDYQAIHCICQVTEQLDASTPRRIPVAAPELTATLTNSAATTMVVTHGGIDGILDGGAPDSVFDDAFDAGSP